MMMNKADMDNNVVMQQPKSSKNKILIALLVALALIAVVLAASVLQNNGKLPYAVSTDESQITGSTVQDGSIEGSMSLNTESQTASVSAPLRFTVKLDTNKRGVVGMDAVVSFDKTAFTVGQVSSLLPGFTAVSSSRKDYLEVTSSKDPQTVEIPVLNNEDVFSFILTPIKAGTFKVELVNAAEKSSTKFIDSDTNIYLPKVNDVVVTVK